MASPTEELPAEGARAERASQADRSFGRRAFLATLLALWSAAAVTFIAINLLLRAEVKKSVVRSLRETQTLLEQARAGRNLRDDLTLASMSANSALGASLRRALQRKPGVGYRSRRSQALSKFARSVRDTLQGQVVAISAPDGRPLTVAPSEGPVALLFSGASRVPGPGVWESGDILYHVMASPVRRHGRWLATVSVGMRFDFAGLAGLGPMALLHGGRVVRSTLSPPASLSDLQPECLRNGCEVGIGGEDFLVLPVSRAAAGAGLGLEDQIISLRPLGAAVNQGIGGFRSRLPSLIVAVALVSFALAALVSRVLSRPLHQLVAHLERSRASGRLEANFPEDSTTREVNLLAAAINRAATAVAHSNERLDQATIDFVETMAQALDARDASTAGHSERVSDYAIAIAAAMRLPPEEIETIRFGARLHDIGKLGISDSLLSKPGRLTAEEYDVVKQHPRIGKRILERVAAFGPYLPLVELHHEDFDGSGYPYGLKGHEIPLDVRIIRVADVFDALTTNRAYRRAMPLDHAYKVILERAGSKFDPDVVLALRAALGNLLHAEQHAPESLHQFSLGWNSGGAS